MADTESSSCAADVSGEEKDTIAPLQGDLVLTNGDIVVANQNGGGPATASDSPPRKSEGAATPGTPKSTDGLIDHENEELRERVQSLEKRVQQQEDEIVCLKSALADVIRRLSQVEAGRVVRNDILPSKPFHTPNRNTPSPRRSSSSSNRAETGQLNRRSSSSADLGGRAVSPSPNRPNPRASPSPGHSMRKWPSVPTSSEFQNSQLTAAKPYPGRWSRLERSGSTSSLSSLRMYPTRAKEPTFNQDEGILRIYLRGRAVSMFAPSDYGDFQITKPLPAPSEKLKLEWAYGYRGRDCRSNLYYLPTGEIVYFIAAVVVLYNVEEQMQRHYLGHTDDVKCLAVHPDKITIATGQVAGHGKDGKPHIRIWNSVSLSTLAVIGIGDFERAVCCVSFSKTDGGQLLCAVDEANEHILSVWDWQKGERGHKITETKSSTEAVLGAEFHPYEKNSLVTCGKSQLAFWTFEGGALSKKQGIFERHDKPKYVTCVAFAESGDVLSGDSNGNLFIWGRGGNRVSQAVTGAHEGGIFSICVLKDGSILTGGGRDRRIVLWNADYSNAGSESEIPEQYGPVRTLSQGKGNLILVGTTRNAILQGSLDLEFSPIVQGHMDELWGLASHPLQHQFVTAAYDRHIFLWDALTHSPIWSKEIVDGAHCAAFYPDGTLIAVGTQSAKWLVLDLTTREIISVHTDGNEQIECIEYSPDGKFLALGSRDNFIYVYQVDQDGRKYSRIGRCSGHSSFVTHLDWSTDSQYMQSNSGDYEILFWSASLCRQVTSASQLRDTQWHTHYCTLGFNVAGIWPDGADGTDINGCCRSNKQSLMATSDDFGKVNLYQYPCPQPKSSSHNYGGHSSHVTAVRFLYDDSRLLSTGGKDMGILQWEIMQ